MFFEDSLKLTKMAEEDAIPFSQANLKIDSESAVQARGVLTYPPLDLIYAVL